MNERSGAITFKGDPLTLMGDMPSVGDQAPDAVLVDNDLSDLSISSYKGKTLALVTVPSLDTSVCDTEARRFNEEAAKLGGDVAVLVASMDLPFAQKRWCGAADAGHVTTASDHRDAALGTAYGILIKELRLLARAVFVIDKTGKVSYVQLVEEMTNEPDYDAALAAIRAAG
ncbi:MAG: thiol peroxidase [Armatimonadia bacterium]|nr:thiol peroxidase [Armatimonadia bacterium]